jgi:putative transposase
MMSLRVVVNRPEPTPEEPQHLCGDKAFDSEQAREVMRQRGYTPHVRSRGKERKRSERKKPRSRAIVHEDGLWRRAIRG